MTFSAGQIRVNFSALPSRGVMIRGAVPLRREPGRLAWPGDDRAGGPAATFAELIGVGALAAVVRGGAGTLLRNLSCTALWAWQEAWS
jgi:hypothetical protein